MVLDWKPCWAWKDYITPTCCAVLNNTLCIASRFPGRGDSLFLCSTPELNEWKVVPTNYEFSSLTTFESKFVTTGGYDHERECMSNEVRSFDGNLTYLRNLPGLSTGRKRMSTVSFTLFNSEYLLAIGGQNSKKARVNVVEILVEDQWLSLDGFPGTSVTMKCTVYSDHVFILGDERKVFYCNVRAFLHDKDKHNLVWKCFQASHCPLAMLSFGRRLITVDELATIRALFDSKEKWIEITSRDNISSTLSTNIITAVISTGQLIVGYGNEALYKISLTGNNSASVVLIGFNSPCTR